MRVPIDQDLKVLQDKSRENYIKRMKKNRWWKKGYKAAKKDGNKDANPYKLSEEIWALLKKRTYWIMGFEEAYYSPSEKRLKKEREVEKKRKKYKDKKHKHHHKDKKRKDDSKN